MLDNLLNLALFESNVNYFKRWTFMDNFEFLWLQPQLYYDIVLSINRHIMPLAYIYVFIGLWNGPNSIYNKNHACDINKSTNTVTCLCLHILSTVILLLNCYYLAAERKFKEGKSLIHIFYYMIGLVLLYQDHWSHLLNKMEFKHLMHFQYLKIV